MKIIGKKVITLSDNEKNILKEAARILDILSDELETFNEEVADELCTAYNICIDTAHRGTFEYDIDDGE